MLKKSVIKEINDEKDMDNTRLDISPNTPKEEYFQNEEDIEEIRLTRVRKQQTFN
ncbi:hypothetical protein IMG5_147070 [Ichthyophthirius multifiliis]|uniref:Uncharacterized protein n=1 Tax=Ichthyophthirius multifiliis TaxID=5932 RepID=G0QY38_ICHMU|nr:hypothetical protein IMG5_147070 [Ichthyophthirius multifiliis]EGR29864.1 hypothetical protein IMG5_147070 [Ichthyophthirius multifiliis]|eukprot:XP_004031100.1 hypothetical protein IMG5_147070 [Ichthyophthirius multifiliis]